MKAVVYHGQEDFRVENVDDPTLLAPTDAIVRTLRTAICGSDLHFWHAPSREVPPFTVGHEVLGIVEDVGSDVRRVKKGDRVIVSCTTGCGLCQMCAHDAWGACEKTADAGMWTNIFGNPLLPGGQAEGIRVPFADTNLWVLPDSIEDERAIFLSDILPTGFMGADLADIQVGDVVVIFGSGPVGVFAQRSAALFGPSAIVAVDLDDERLAKAAGRGCVTVNPTKQDLKEVVANLTNGRGADCAIEAVGSVQLVNDCIDIVRAGGRVSVIGVILEDPIQIPMMGGMMGKNLTLRGGMVEPQKYIPRLLPMIEQGRLDPTEIITHRLPLDRAIDGYRIFANHEENVLKVVLEP
ncbi:MAG: alcohol dehydrogenase catalytic domain-containing protein [Myxococcota bacterium]